MKRVLGTILLVLLFHAATAGVATAVSAGDPAQNVNRLRIEITTTADWTRLTVPVEQKIVISEGSVVTGSPGVVSADSSAIFVGRNSYGSTATVRYEALVSNNDAYDGQWKIEKGWGQSARIDIYNINDVNNPVLIASHTNAAAQGNPVYFAINQVAESQGGPLSAGSMGEKKVFAVYYPWWTPTNNWNTNSLITDRPVSEYDTRNQSDVNRVVGAASGYGLDGFLVSWQGRDHWTHNGFQKVLSAANGRNDFTVAAYLETRVANSTHSHNQPPDPAYLKQWLADLIGFGQDPDNTGYQKMDGRPVIFVYWVKDISPQEWREIFDELRAQGKDAFYVADYTGLNASDYAQYVDVFDGMNMYNPATYTNVDYALATRSAMTRTHSLFKNPSAARKLWVGTAVPGMDMTLLGGGVIGRENGAFYQRMWESNLAQYPDWMMISTWNEYYENTHIESTSAHGGLYGDLTRSLVSRYKSDGAATPPVISGLSASAFLPGGFEVSWTTDRATSAILEYGTQPGVYTASVRGNRFDSQHRLAVDALPAGMYYAKVRSTGSNGVVATSGEFAVTVPDEAIPNLDLTAEQTYWSDFASYSAGILTVDFRMTNTGNTDSVNTRIIHTQGSSGAMATGTLPSVGTVPAGGSVVMPIRWQLPSGISSFQANLWAQAATGSGTTVYYPGPPPAGN